MLGYKVVSNHFDPPYRQPMSLDTEGTFPLGQCRPTYIPCLNPVECSRIGSERKPWTF